MEQIGLNLCLRCSNAWPCEPPNAPGPAATFSATSYVFVWLASNLHLVVSFAILRSLNSATRGRHLHKHSLPRVSWSQATLRQSSRQPSAPTLARPLLVAFIAHLCWAALTSPATAGAQRTIEKIRYTILLQYVGKNERNTHEMVFSSLKILHSLLRNHLSTLVSCQTLAALQPRRNAAEIAKQGGACRRQSHSE
jgi:hypothetical protein